MSLQEVKSHVLSTIAAGFLVEGRSLCSTLHGQDLPHPKASLSLFNYLLHYLYLLGKHLEDLFVCILYPCCKQWDSCLHPPQQYAVLNEEAWASLQDEEENLAGQ